MTNNGKHEIRLLTPANYEEWDQFITTVPGGSVFSSSVWLSAVARLTGGVMEILAVYQKDKLVAGMGLVSFQPLSMLKVFRAIPLTPYTSIVIKPRNTRQEAKRASYHLTVLDLIAKTLEEDADSIEILGQPGLIDVRPFSWRGWRSAVMYTYVIDISDPKRLWDEGIDPFIRNRVRKCREDGMEVQKGSDARVLYEIVSQTYEKQGLQMTTDEEPFVNLCKVLIDADRFDVYVAELDSEPISAYGMVRDYHGRILGLFGGTRPEYLKSGAAAFTLWSIIEDGAEHGFDRVDLTGANMHSIATFKSQFGGELTPYYQMFTENRRGKVFNWGWQRANDLGVSDWIKSVLS